MPVEQQAELIFHGGPILTVVDEQRAVEVVLTTNLPERGLQAGDIGTVVPVHQEGRATLSSY